MAGKPGVPVASAVVPAAPVLARLGGYSARVAEIDGCTYREGLNAVGIAGGVAGTITVVGTKDASGNLAASSISEGAGGLRGGFGAGRAGGGTSTPTP